MVPDDARLRLQTLAAPPVPGVPRGWPAPEGTPGARLWVAEEPPYPEEGAELPGDGPPDDGGSVPVGPDAFRPGSVGPDAFRPGSVGPGSVGPAARSAWDEPRRGPARWLPASWLTARWDPGGWGAIGLAVVAALAAVVAAVGVWAGRPVSEPVPALPVVAGAPAGASPLSPAAAPAPGGPVVVNVAGKVRHPGLVTMREGARVGEALDAAGGPLPAVDLTPLNLAARVVDGQQILVGVAAPPASVAPGPAGGASAGAASAGSSAGAPAPGGKLDLNAASLEQLDGLPGVGPVTAKKILDWRTQNGRFTAVEQLREIPGIGDARFGTLRDLVRV